MEYQFCASYSNKSFIFSLSNDNNILSNLKEEIYKRISILPKFQRLVVNGKELCHCNIDTDKINFIDVKLRLDGGKGGYGYLLRNGNTGIRKKKTTNFKSCRNLDGRRLRDVEFMKLIEKVEESNEDPNKIDLDDFDEEPKKTKEKTNNKKRKPDENNEYQEMLERKKKLEEKKNEMRKELIEETSHALEKGIEKSFENLKESELKKKKETKVAKIYGDTLFDSDDDDDDDDIDNTKIDNSIEVK